MEFFQHFACYTKLPVRLDDIKAQVLDTGEASKIIRVPLTLRDYVVYGGYNSYRDLTAYASNTGHAIIAQIGYPKDLTEDWQRMVIVKEMLHILNPIQATASTKEKVNNLLSDLFDRETKESLGLPAHFDHNGMFQALCVLMPRGVVDVLRPLSKKDPVRFSTARIAGEAHIPESYVKIALTDEWLRFLDTAF